MSHTTVRLTLPALLISLVTSSVQAGLLQVSLFGVSESSTDLNSTVTAEAVIDDFGQFIDMRGRSSAESLGVDMFVQGRNGRARAFSITSSLQAEVIFVSAPDITTAQIAWSADVAGTISGNSGAAGSFNGGQFGAQLSIGNQTEQVDGSTVIEAGDPAVNFDTQVSLFANVPTNVPVSITALLSVGHFGGALPGENIRINFFDSLAFNPDSFFDIKTSGVTANSVDGDWLVNNQLPTANVATIPEPATLWSGLCLLGVAGLRCRRRLLTRNA